MIAPTWQRVPHQMRVWTMKIGPLRLNVTDDGWWSPFNMKKQAALSLGGAQVKALIWAREQLAEMQAAMDAIDPRTP